MAMAAVALELEMEQENRPLARKRKEAKPESPHRVLLIEDSEDAMWLVRYAIEEHGSGEYRLEWANSLIHGLEHLSKGSADVIILDLGLPESSGPESYAWVREIAPKTPVVVLTGDSRDETEFAVTASGAEGYLMKDLASGALLIRSIRAALYANKQRQEERDIIGKQLRIEGLG
jgi:DNA-binding response OmpR family regulator